MEEKKLDLRIRKTYLALTSTLLEMMGEMPFEDIRVVELCERAMIRKSTFYKHFADKYELLAFCVRQRREAVITEDLELAPKAFYECFLDAIFAFIHENEAFFRTATSSNAFPFVIQTLSSELIPGIRRRLLSDREHGYLVSAAPAVLASFLVGGTMEAIRDWYLGGRKLSETLLREQIEVGILKMYEEEKISQTEKT